MPKRRDKGDVAWMIPKRKRPIAYSTRATSDIIAILSEMHNTINDVRAAIVCSEEAKMVLDAYISRGYGTQIAREWFK